MLSLIKLFFLFNGLIFISGFCPDIPTVQTTSITSTSAVVLTKDTVGLTTNFPTTAASKRQMEFFGTFKIGEACTGATAPAQKSLLSITVTTTDTTVTPSTTTENQLLRLYVDCATLKLETEGVWATPLGTTTTRSALTGAADIKDESISIFLAVDLANNYYSLEYLTKSYYDAHLITMTTTQTYAFDGTTKIYLCAAKAGASANACLASDVKVGFLSTLTTRTTPMIGNVGGTTPTLASFYPLDGSLANANTANSVGDAYFGDDADEPTTATVATWDTSKTFVKVSTFGQILSVPLPTLKSADGTTTGVTSKTLAVAAWVKILTLPAKTTTSVIFSMHQESDGAAVGYKLLVDQVSNELSLVVGTTAVPIYGSATAPKITLDTWTLVGFSVVLSSDGKNSFGTFFADATAVQFSIRASTTAVSLATADLLRVGSIVADNSWTGDISIVRITSPGAGFIKSGTERCSTTDNQIELGSGLFGLSCAADFKLNVLDSKCYETCPAGTIASTGTLYPLCVSCPEGCATCDSTGCLTCPTGDVLYKKECFDSCTGATYQSGLTCVDCRPGCTLCNAAECFACSVTKGYIAEPNKGVCYLMDPKAGTGPGVAGIVCAALILIGYLIYAYNSEENLSIYGSKQNIGFKSVANYQN